MFEAKNTNVSNQNGQEYFELFHQSVNHIALISINMLSVEDRVKQLRLNHAFNILMKRLQLIFKKKLF